MKCFSCLILLLGALANASVSRISEPNVNTKDVTQIFASPGLVSVLQFPENILEVRIGDTASLKAEISKVTPSELTLGFGSSSSQPTNLIVRTQKKTFVFDVVPASNQHQDVVKIGRNLIGANPVKEVLSQKISLDSKAKEKASINKKRSGRIGL